MRRSSVKQFLVKLLMNGMVVFARLEAAVMPRSWLTGMGWFAARMTVRHARGTREALYANGRRLLGPDVSHERLRRFATDVVGNFGEFFVALLRAPRDYPPAEQLIATMRGRAHGERALALDRGVIAVTLHLGWYELGSVLSERFQPAAVVYRPDPFGLVEKLRSRTRDLAAVGEIRTDSPTFGVAALDLLRRGGSVFAAGDIGFAGEAVGRRYEFLGAPAPFHDWPARLSVASRAPILPCFVVRENGDGDTAAPRVCLEEPILPEDAGGDVDEIMRRLIAVFERYVRAYPEQWLILHRYWVE